MAVSVWGVDHGDEVSKAKHENPRKEGLAYKDKAARKRTMQDASRQASFVRGPNVKANWKTYGKNTAGGAGVGAAAGSALGGYAAGKRGAAAGALVGGAYGAVGGAVTGGTKVQTRSVDSAFRNAKKRGDLKKKNYSRFKLSPVND